jgi:hypothetical protein
LVASVNMLTHARFFGSSVIGVGYMRCIPYLLDLLPEGLDVAGAGPGAARAGRGRFGGE